MSVDDMVIVGWDHSAIMLRKSQDIRSLDGMSSIEERVRSLIEDSGRSQREFAVGVGLDAPKLSKSLSGARRFSSLDLARIAEFTGETVDWLLTGERPIVAVAARAAAGSATEVALREASALVQIRDDLAELGYRQHWQLPERPLRSGRWDRDGELLAERALAALASAGCTPWDPDLAGVVESVFGVDVAVRPLGQQFDGLSVASDNCRLILLAPADAPFRPRFTLAHELGHLIGADDQGIHVDEDIFRTGLVESEVRANAFAAAFLMPLAQVLALVGERPTRESFCRTATQLRVSPSALAARLEKARLIDAGTKTSWSAISAREAAHTAGDRTTLADAISVANSIRPPGLLARAAFAAYEDGETTIRLYARITGQDPEALARSLEASAP